MSAPLRAIICFHIKAHCFICNGEMAGSRKGRNCTRFNFSMKFTYKPDLKIWVSWRQEESTAGRRKGEGDDDFYFKHMY